MNIKSLRDAGYQQAKINSTLEDVARYAMAAIPTLGNPDLSRADQFTKEQRDQLSEGYVLHYGEAIKPERLFAIVDGNYVEKSAKEIEKLNVEKFALNVNVAFAVSQQMLNEMKTSDKVRYQLIQGLKTDTNAYVSNRLGDLISKAKKIWKERAGIKAERVQALAFAEFEKKAMDTMLERVRNADARGNDPSANVELTKRRIAAYWAAK
jgi:hypothetical protein